MGEEGRPLRVAPPPDLSAAHRVAVGAREARARVVEGGCGAPPAAAFATGSLLEGQRSCKRHCRSGRSAVGSWCPPSWAKPVIWQNVLQQCAEPNAGSAMDVCNYVLALTRPAVLGQTGNRPPGEQSLRVAGRTRRPTKTSHAKRVRRWLARGFLTGTRCTENACDESAGQCDFGEPLESATDEMRSPPKI